MLLGESCQAAIGSPLLYINVFAKYGEQGVWALDESLTQQVFGSQDAGLCHLTVC